MHAKTRRKNSLIRTRKGCFFCIEHVFSQTRTHIHKAESCSCWTCSFSQAVVTGTSQTSGIMSIPIMGWRATRCLKLTAHLPPHRRLILAPQTCILRGVDWGCCLFSACLPACNISPLICLQNRLKKTFYVSSILKIITFLFLASLIFDNWILGGIIIRIL